MCLAKVSTAKGCTVAALYDPARQRWHPGGLELQLPAGSNTHLCMGAGTGGLLCFKVRRQELDSAAHSFLVCDPVAGDCRNLPPLVLRASVCRQQ